ncbi:hypothetical protein [Halomarina oriensis]|uniref:Uncharacterized protein n=1 Tax=Halomarina oriensis TaxID=671145 RepID=A0A6B0GPI1_9EURY|nr:hypothetical protein [Halomarina oriensis]MWG33528.1 hypothetical protein [Halomarina oriensis]
MTGYYDIVLGLIPLALLGISGGLYAAGFAVPTAVSFAGLVAVTLIGHALFVRGPTDSTPVPTDTRPFNAD